MSDCQVCCESKKLVVECFKCNYTCCRECSETYIFGKKEIATCMSCNVVWDRRFLAKNFTLKFQKAYQDLKKEIFYIQEQVMFEATQVEVEKKIELGRIDAEIKKLYKLITALDERKRSLTRAFRGVTEKREFVRQCPGNECLGFLNQALVCKLCGIKACRKCREIKKEEDGEHVCDPGVVENVKFLESDSKGCPQCAARISKISGCDQMFCTSCKCIFDWKSMRIGAIVIHNPHYMEYMRNGGASGADRVIPRQPGDIQCARIIDMDFMRGLKGDLLQEARFVNHVQQVTIHRYREGNGNLDLRIKYMTKEIDKKGFLKVVSMRNKRSEMNQEIVQVLRMYVDCATDILYRVHNRNRDIRVDGLAEIEKLKEYCRGALDEITGCYKVQNVQF